MYTPYIDDVYPRWCPQVRLVICGWLMGWLHFYFNKTMSRYSFLTKMMESPIEKHQTVAAFLENCHNCIYGEKHNEYFHCLPPTLEDYLSQ